MLAVELDASVDVRSAMSREGNQVRWSVGSSQRVREDTGWEPSIPLARSVADVARDAARTVGVERDLETEGPG